MHHHRIPVFQHLFCLWLGLTFQVWTKTLGCLFIPGSVIQPALYKYSLS